MMNGEKEIVHLGKGVGTGKHSVDGGPVSSAQPDYLMETMAELRMAQLANTELNRSYTHFLQDVRNNSAISQAKQSSYSDHVLAESAALRETVSRYADKIAKLEEMNRSLQLQLSDVAGSLVKDKNDHSAKVAELIGYLHTLDRQRAAQEAAWLAESKSAKVKINDLEAALHKSETRNRQSDLEKDLAYSQERVRSLESLTQEIWKENQVLMNKIAPIMERFDTSAGEPGQNYSQISFDEQMEFLSDCHLFDGEWYRDRYGDDAEIDGSRLKHYVVIGAKLGNLPGPYFDGVRYVAENLDVREAKLNPLFHYVKFGKDEGRPAWDAIARVDNSARF